jgi:hypothetical protein
MCQTTSAAKWVVQRRPAATKETSDGSVVPYMADPHLGRYHMQPVSAIWEENFHDMGVGFP